MRDCAIIARKLEKVMKRRLYVIACICLSLVTVLSSCTLDDLEGNVYERMGMVKFDNPAVNDVSNRLDSMETEKVGDDAFVGEKLDLSKVDGFKEIYKTIMNIGKEEGSETEINFEIDLGENAEYIKEKGLLKPQENKDDLYASIGNSLASSSGTKAFVSSMSEPAGEIQSNAAKGTMALTNSLITTLTESMQADGDMPEEVKTILTDLQKELGDKSKKPEDLTKAEVLQVQMITNLVSSVADAADTLKDVEDMSTVMNDSNVMSIMDDLTLLSNVTNTLSGNTDVLAVPNISDLISKFTGSGSES